MKTLNYKISGVTPIKVLSASNKVGENPTMTICNIKTTSCDVSVYYFKEIYAVDGSGNANNSTETFYVLKSFNIPNNKTMTLDKTDMSFNNKGFDLYISLGASTEDVDVIITL